VANLVFVVGLAVFLQRMVEPKKTWHRTGLLAIAALLAFRYAWWRWSETLAPPGLTIEMLGSWSLFVLEMAALAGSLSALLMLTRHRDRASEVDAVGSWWGDAPPRVAVLIATYNEEMEVLERTIVCAKVMHHENKEVIVLDDGKRDWLKEYCFSQGVRYITRPDNFGSKAGNINNALSVLAQDSCAPDFVAVLDADFVPHHGFLSRSLALFHDPEVGLVQTPQHFFNSDPIQHNLGISRSYPDEQRFFFDHLQPSRDAWGVAFCCGTSSIARWSAFQDVGGFPTESVTEDFMMTLVLRDAGWSTVYLSEPLSEGLAPEGLKEYVTQRSRWCLGMMQIARSNLGPFARNNLRLRDRWSVLDAVFYWVTTFPFRLAAIVYPLLYWFLNITVVDARLADVISYFGCYYFWTIISLNTISRGMVVPILNDVSQLLGAIPITRAAVTGLLRPKGHPFKVTAKGGNRNRIVIQWRMILPLIVMFVLTLWGMTIGILSDNFAFSDAGDGKWVILSWTVYNFVVLAISITACVELPRREIHVMDQPEQAIIEIGGEIRRVWLASLAAESARIRGVQLPENTRGEVHIKNVGKVQFRVCNKTQDGARVILRPDAEQKSALLIRFHAQDGTPGILSARASAMFEDLGRRLSFAEKLD
jgi:cellulose synthase/poly-beta-1,6-N-acetylglucosamine synthase-like glycosyltransferase